MLDDLRMAIIDEIRTVLKYTVYSPESKPDLTLKQFYVYARDQGGDIVMVTFDDTHLNMDWYHKQGIPSTFSYDYCDPGFPENFYSEMKNLE